MKAKIHDLLTDIVKLGFYITERKQKQTHRHRKQMWLPKAKGRGGGIN